MKNHGYYRYPGVRGNTVVFVCEDDLWQVPLKGGNAVRITANTGAASVPRLSPDGKYLAYNGSEEGSAEIFIKPTSGGEQKRLTFHGAFSSVIDWSADSKYIYFASNFEQIFDTSIYRIPLEGGSEEKIGAGYANQISFGPKGCVITKHARDSARWKRYRGGTAGEIWIDEKGKWQFSQILKDLKSNIANPMWIGSRIYFLSDHEGIGNIYSCNTKGKDLKRHTNHDEFYARNPHTDGRTIVYHAGADLFRLDVKTGKNEMIKVGFISSHTQLQRKFIDTQEYLEDFDVSAKGTHTALTARGKAVSMANWTGPVRQTGKKDGVRYRHPVWLYDNKRFVIVSDEHENEDRILIVDPVKNTETLLKNIPLCRIWKISPSPKDDRIVVLNNRNEIHIVDLKKKTSKLIDRSERHRIETVSWSPDAKWIAYEFTPDKLIQVIKIADSVTGKTHTVTETVLSDNHPVFSEDGKYMFFISERTFNPVGDAVQFELSFMKASKIYALPLLKETGSPFILDPKTPAGEDPEEKKDDKKDKKDGKKKEVEVKIDFDGIEKRILEFPIETSHYSDLATFGKKILYAERVSSYNENKKGNKIVLKTYDLEAQKEETVIDTIKGYRLSLDRKSMIVRTDDGLLVLKAGAKPDDKASNKFSLEGGGIDLSRVKIGLIPREEWKQMYREAWLLQREHFWTENLSSIDWVKVYNRYYPLISRVGSRGEFSDLIWEMQGELGTSHCYEWGGDYRKPKNYPMGKLGCGYKLSEDGNSYTFEKILNGDPSNNNEMSPLLRPGINVQNGDTLIAVNGTKVDKKTHPKQLLVNFPDQYITLTIQRKGKKTKEDVVVRTLAFEQHLQYRNWVETNRQYVHKKSRGRTGYIHIPDMGFNGFAEFHRLWLSECEYDSLIVDVRYNGGGFVSQLILEKLNRKIIGYDITRYDKQPMTYPSYAVAGPIVSVTNEFAGSDGDIFSHSFKLMKMGTLIGKRTWGGVIGINGQYQLADGSGTTQPEYSFWFKDVGWGVENYGTDPDIEVDIKPQDYTDGKDPQLDKALEIVTAEMKKKPVKHPKFDKRPNLALPKLPKAK
ncbi:MAG TPA: PDZ domain-containing protein [Clostridiales bacterium]|nr:PDZ domain-containing protein [Clostridiales bacterium]